MNKKQRQVGLINNDDKNSYFKEIFEKHFREKFDEISELINETSFDDLIFCFKGDRKIFDDFVNGI